MPQLQPDTQLSAYTSKIRRPRPSSSISGRARVKKKYRFSALNILYNNFPVFSIVTNESVIFYKYTKKATYLRLLKGLTLVILNFFSFCTEFLCDGFKS